MSIEVKCLNIVRYDKQRGQYVYCHNVITVDESQLGTTIDCPACGGSVEVVRPALEGLDDFSRVQEEELEEVVVESTQPDWTFDRPPQAEPAGPRIQQKCINCHAPLPADAQQCPACGYLQPPQGAAPGEPVGFHRWFRQHLTEGASPLGVLALAAALCATLMVLCVGYTLVVYGRRVILLGIPFVLIAIVLAVLVLANRRPGEPWLAAIRRVVNPWTALLILARAWSWREPSWPFRRRKTLDRRDAPFSDEDLIAAEGLWDFQVMDLEGTQITDEGLERLRQATQLRFLVVRRTQVTPEGVQQLQRAQPNLWIWS